MLFFVTLLIFLCVFLSIPLPLVHDSVSDHLCVCMSVQVKACVKGSNNPSAHTLQTKGFLFLYSLLSHYFTSSFFKIGATVASTHLGCNMTNNCNKCSYSYKAIHSWQRGSSQADEIENSIISVKN